jgi:hypothetical protein
MAIKLVFNTHMAAECSRPPGGTRTEEIAMSKQIKAMFTKYPERFESWHRERHDGQNDYWVYCRDPYYCPSMECGTIHEYTVGEVLQRMREVTVGEWNGHGYGPPARQ